MHSTLRREITLARRLEPPEPARRRAPEDETAAPDLPRRPRPQPQPTHGPGGPVRWWQRPAPGGDEALWAAVRRIQTRRQQLGMSVTTLAHRLDSMGHPITRETLSRVLNGKQPTSWPTVRAMAEVLEVDLSEGH